MESGDSGVIVGGKLAQIGSRLILAQRDEVNEVPASPAASPARTNPAAIDSPGPRWAAWGLIALGVAVCLFAYIAWKLYSAS